MEHPRHQYPQETAGLQRIAQSCGLLEKIKWGKPCFTLEGKNIVLIQRFNNYIALLFFKGALLKDSEKLLSRVGEHMQAPRQLRFSCLADITRLSSTIKIYIKQAIDLEKSGAKVELKRVTEVRLPEELQTRLDTNPALDKAFAAYARPSKAYIYRIAAAKLSATRASRVDKYIPQILAGKGLNELSDSRLGFLQSRRSCETPIPSGTPYAPMYHVRLIAEGNRSRSVNSSPLSFAGRFLPAAPPHPPCAPDPVTDEPNKITTHLFNNITPASTPPRNAPPSPWNRSTTTSQMSKPQPTHSSTFVVTESRLNANRQNAQHSTGPRTAEGKSVSSQNAIKTALTGRTVLLPTDDAELYATHTRPPSAPSGSPSASAKPSSSSPSPTSPGASNASPASKPPSTPKAAPSSPTPTPDEPAPIRKQLIELDIYQANERELRNLALYESRLRRQRDRDIAELRFLQAERQRIEEEQQGIRRPRLPQSQTGRQPFDPAALGFVFSIAEIEAFIALRLAQRQHRHRRPPRLQSLPRPPRQGHRVARTAQLKSPRSEDRSTSVAAWRIPA